MAENDTLIGWLNDAYGMESSSKEMLERHAKDFDDQPEIQQALQNHISQTEGHLEAVRACLEELGSSPSQAKGALGSMSGVLQGMSTGMYADEQVKNLLADYTAEQFEIASYTALIAAAEALGQDEIAQRCQEILQEEEEAAQQLIDHLPQIVEQTAQAK